MTTSWGASIVSSIGAGFLTKSTRPEEIAEAIRKVHRGSSGLPVGYTLVAANEKEYEPVRELTSSQAGCTLVAR